MKKFLIRHVGNMGDMIFFIPPVLKTLKRQYPDCHITFVTAWGFKEKKRSWLPGRSFSQGWGKRNQGGFSIHLMITNPHVDQLVHWHDTKISLERRICIEDGQALPTWSAQYYDQQKSSGRYDGIFELDFGIKADDNPIKKMYEAIGLPDETYSDYKLYLTDHDRAVAEEVMAALPRPRLVLLEGIEGTTTRGWDPAKVEQLASAVEQTYGVAPIWFGSQYPHYYQGRPLSLRENIATLTQCDVGIGVMSGPIHFAAAVALPTITLYCDHPLDRAAPAYFLNQYVDDPQRYHRTVLGPTGSVMHLLKDGTTQENLTPAEWHQQRFESWNRPGRQSTKSCLAVITVDEVMTVLHDAIAQAH